MKLLSSRLLPGAKKQTAERSGAVTVEFAIVAPIIFVLFLGGLELAALNFARQTLGIAAYEAARKVIIPGGTTTQGQTEGIRQMNLVGLGTGASCSISTTATSVTATMSVPAANVSWGLVRFSSGATLRESCTLTKE